VNQTTPSRTHHAAPPYSWTAVRAFKPSGSRSTQTPSAPRRTSWVRPPSLGRPSAHTTESPSTASSPSRTASATTSSDVNGVGQDPYGADVTGSN
jgi:hypothetical protein